jgi:hypothetical protein
MYFHANIETQLKEVLKYASLLNYIEVKNQNEMADFTDGRIYKKLIESIKMANCSKVVEHSV